MIGTTDVSTPTTPTTTPSTSTRSTRCSTTGRSSSPASAAARALRVWTGVRPLFEDAKASDTDTRDVTRAHALLDHAQRDGVGALRDDHRRQADDLPADGRGDDRRRRQAARRHPPVHDRRPSRSPALSPGETYRLGERLARKEASLIDEQMICECELVPRHKLEEAMTRTASTNLDDIRRQLRLGMGPCQGGFCIYRATGILHGHDGLSAEQADQVAAGLPAGALEGSVADPLRRPAAPGPPRRLDLPGRARRGASGRNETERAALRRGRDRRRHRRADRGHAAGAGRRARRACWPRASARRTWRRRRSTCSATRPSASTLRGRRSSSSSPRGPTIPTRCSAPRS